MNLSTTIGKPTLDKVHLKAFSYDLAPKNKFYTLPVINSEGEVVSEKKICNASDMNLTVKRDLQGKECATIFYNPNKISDKKLFQQCNEHGLDFDMDNSELTRLDIERHMQLKHKIDSYHFLLKIAGSGNKTTIQHDGTFTTGTKPLQWQIYDKSAQTKFHIPNICRGETRYLKTKYLRSSGIRVYKDLADVDLMDLYNKPFKMYLGNLNKCKSFELEKMSSDIQLLEYLFEKDSRPLTTFLTYKGLDTLGLDYMVEVIMNSSIPSDKKSKAKNYLFKLSERLNIGFQSDMVEELLTYFQAVA